MWRAKLDRMMAELPEKYLQPRPANPEDFMQVPPGSKPVSQITEEERRLIGVYHQLIDVFRMEEEAHDVLHGQVEDGLSLEICKKHRAQALHREAELEIISLIFTRSLLERLGFENDYIVNGSDVYAVPSVAAEIAREEVVEDQPAPDDFDNFGPDPWSGIKH